MGGIYKPEHGTLSYNLFLNQALTFTIFYVTIINRFGRRDKRLGKFSKFIFPSRDNKSCLTRKEPSGQCRRPGRKDGWLTFIRKQHSTMMHWMRKKPDKHDQVPSYHLSPNKPVKPAQGIASSFKWCICKSSHIPHEYKVLWELSSKNSVDAYCCGLKCAPLQTHVLKP